MMSGIVYGLSAAMGQEITFDGGEPAAGPPSEFRALLASDLSKWSKIARELRMQPN
jgi:hypothetical protein